MSYKLPFRSDIPHHLKDFNNFKLFGKKYVWESEQKVPVGKFETKSMTFLLDEVMEKQLGDVLSERRRRALGTRRDELLIEP